VTHVHKVNVTRDGRWWMIDVPDIGQLTQARRVDEIEDMARSLIAVSTDVPLANVEVDVIIDVAGLGDIAARARAITEHRCAALQAAQESMRESAQYAYQLMQAGVTVRDAGALLDLSPQRVSQLVHSEHADA
jgi:hypothetical protein